jgi:hypothetical protein
MVEEGSRQIRKIMKDQSKCHVAASEFYEGLVYKDVWYVTKLFAFLYGFPSVSHYSNITCMPNKEEIHGDCRENTKLHQST